MAKGAARQLSSSPAQALNSRTCFAAIPACMATTHAYKGLVQSAYSIAFYAVLALLHGTIEYLSLSPPSTSPGRNNLPQHRK